MKDAPSFEAIEHKVREIFVNTLQPESEVPGDQALIEELGFDSLDMIEFSFALEEFFDLEFASRNAIVELDRILGNDRVLHEGKLTPLGLQVALERMPELRETELPAELSVNSLPSYFTLHTFVRIIKESYDSAPEKCPETGEEAVIEDFKVVAKDSRQPIPMPAGDQILDRWLEARAAELGTKSGG